MKLLQNLLNPSHLVFIIAALMSLVILVNHPSFVALSMICVGFFFFIIISNIEPRHTRYVSIPFALVTVFFLSLATIEHSDFLSYCGIVITPLNLINLAICLHIPKFIESESFYERICCGAIIIAINFIAMLFDQAGIFTCLFTMLSLYMCGLLHKHVEKLVKIHLIVFLAMLSIIVGFGRTSHDVKTPTLLEQTLPSVQQRLDKWKDCISNNFENKSRNTPEVNNIYNIGEHSCMNKDTESTIAVCIFVIFICMFIIVRRLNFNNDRILRGTCQQLFSCACYRHTSICLEDLLYKPFFWNIHYY